MATIKVKKQKRINPQTLTEERKPAHVLETFAIMDNKTEQFNMPSCYLNEFEARRSCERLLTDPRQETSLIVTNPQDFDLYRIGFFDQLTGKLTPLIPKKHILNFGDVKKFLAKQPKG